MNVISAGQSVVQCAYPACIVNYKYADLTNWGLDSNQFIIPGRYERDLVDWAMQFVTPETQFVDVGAHIGSWTLLMAPRAKQVTAFEPQRMRYYQLCGNLALNNLDNVVAVNCGLASPERRNTHHTLYKFRQDSGSSTLREDVKRFSDAVTPAFGSESVYLTCLDDHKLTNVSLLKLDVEGFELEVLKGAVDTLTRCRPHIVLELWDQEWFKEDRTATLQWLADHNYQTMPISGYSDNYLAAPLPLPP